MRSALRTSFRCFSIAWSLCKWSLWYVAHRAPLEDNRPSSVNRLRGRALASLLEELGATFIKFGQIMSTRPDILPPELTETLSKLQDQVRPEDPDDMHRAIQAHLGDPTTVFAEWDPVPIAAASVAQVHRAKLLSGEEVAVKVLRPGIHEQVERDLGILTRISQIVSLNSSVALLSLSGAVERFSSAMRDQLDFRKEAKNNERFTEIFASVEGVNVPMLYPEHCGDSVLTMEFIHGVRASEAAKVTSDRRSLALRGFHAIMKMVFDDGFVHADLHPGNIFLNDSGIVFVDLGLVAEIEPELMAPWIESFIAISSQDGRLAAKLFYTYAPNVGSVDYPTFERQVVDHFASVVGIPFSEVEASHVLGGMMNILRQNQVQIDPVFTVVHIAVLVAEGLGKQLDPTLDLIQVAAPHLIQAMAKAPPARPPNRKIPTIQTPL